jgi:hypothetical protein
MTTKILFIDDNLTRWNTANYRAEVVFDNSVRKYFAFDDAGNDCQLLFNEEDFAYVFIHHSQQDGSELLPSNLMDLIKPKLGSKLVLFSGNIAEHFLNTDSPYYIYRTIKRPKLMVTLPEFIKKSIAANEWIIEIAYGNYEQSLINLIRQMISKGDEDSRIKASPELTRILLLKQVTTGSTEYHQIMSLENDELIEALRNL